MKTSNAAVIDGRASRKGSGNYDVGRNDEFEVQQWNEREKMTWKELNDRLGLDYFVFI